MGTADAYPIGPVRVLVGAPAGGPLDIAARLIAPWLSERLGQPFQVDNLTGDHSNRAARTVRDAAPDGHTLLLCGPIYPINNALNPDKHILVAVARLTRKKAQLHVLDHAAVAPQMWRSR